MQTTYKYRATNYTGANVSIMLGPHLLTQCFGIEYSLQQSKRPIYGYNSQYYDGVANGLVLVTGALHLNFVHPGYLSTVLQKYHTFVNSVRELSDPARANDLVSYLSVHEGLSPLVNIIRDAVDPPVGLGIRPNEVDEHTYSEVGLLNAVTPQETVDSQIRPNLDSRVPDRLNLNMSNSERTRALDQALNLVFEDEGVQQDLIQFFTGGISSGGSVLIGDDGNAYYESQVFNADKLNSLVERNQPLGACSNDLMTLARPDQFGSAESSPYGIDIMVHFGPPYGGVEQNQIINYSNRASFVLKDVTFTGESSQIMASDEPIIETYTFMARKKETLGRTSGQSNQ